MTLEMTLKPATRSLKIVMAFMPPQILAIVILLQSNRENESRESTKSRLEENITSLACGGLPFVPRLHPREESHT
jgi:hypothetical protein